MAELMTTEISVATDEEVVRTEADDIAKKLTDFLIQGFVTKTGKEPTTEEIEHLFDELTEERFVPLNKFHIRH